MFGLREWWSSCRKVVRWLYGGSGDDGKGKRAYRIARVALALSANR